MSMRILKVALLVFRVHCGTFNSNQSKQCECIMKFPLIHFNVHIPCLLEYASSNNSNQQKQSVEVHSLRDLTELVK